MQRITRRHKIIRILILIAAAVAWMGPPRPPRPPGCPFPGPPLPPPPPHPYQQSADPAPLGAVIAIDPSASR